MTTKQASEDNRSDKNPIAKKLIVVTIDPATHASIGEKDVLLNGEIVGLIYDTPSLDGAADDLIFKIEDKDDVEYHEKTAISQYAQTYEKLLPDTSPERFGFAGMATCQYTSSADQTSTCDLNVLILMR